MLGSEAKEHPPPGSPLVQQQVSATGARTAFGTLTVFQPAQLSDSVGIFFFIFALGNCCLNADR